MPRLYSSRFTFNCVARQMLMIVVACLASFYGVAQEPGASATLHGVIRDADGKPVAQASVVLQKKDAISNFTADTDGKGAYSFTKLHAGVYTLRATKGGYADAQLSGIFIQPREEKTVDLTLGAQPAGQGSATSAPQFFDQPQFTVAGVTDTTSLGGHGSDTVVRTRDSLAKETASLAAGSATETINAARETSLREAAQRQPDDFNANHQLGRFLIATRRSREALPFLERAAAKNPANYENAYDLALANAQTGSYVISRDDAKKLLAHHDNADLHHLLGDVEEKLGDSLEAVRQYQRAAELDPTESYVFDWGAELLLHHAPEPAQEVFSKGNRRFPDSARMLLGLGAASFARGIYDEAVQRICRASDLNPNDPAPYEFLGRIEQAENKPTADLVEKLHRFVTLQPHNANANYYYALGLWKLRNDAGEKADVSRVESLLMTALQLDPKHVAARLQLGIVHSDQGAYSEAISDYRKALEADPQLEEAHYRLAQAYRQIGDSEKAKEELRLYGELTKQSEQKLERERHEIKQFVYTLRDPSSPQVQ